jgi:type VI secretion system Hcp family effector
MAIDIFLVIPENPANPPVDGTAAADQSVAATFPNATVISVSSFELGIENPVSLGSATGGAGAGKVQFDPLIIQKAVDHASPSLFSAASSGRNFQAVQLYLRSSGPAAQPFLAYEFRTVLITKIDWSGNTGGSGRDADARLRRRRGRFPAAESGRQRRASYPGRLEPGHQHHGRAEHTGHQRADGVS